MDDSTKDKQEALDRRYIRMASIWAENSYCQRRQVGALIVKDKMIISDGYNGTPSCLLYTSPSPRDRQTSRMPSSA